MQQALPIISTHFETSPQPNTYANSNGSGANDTVFSQCVHEVYVTYSDAAMASHSYCMVRGTRPCLLYTSDAADEMD